MKHKCTTHNNSLLLMTLALDLGDYEFLTCPLCHYHIPC